jgi:alkylated DNA repair dioxygenase AlkB
VTLPIPFAPERIDLDDTSWVIHEPGFLDETQQEVLLHHLRDTASWRQERKWLFGREVAQPRLTAWYGLGWTWDSGYRSARDDTQPIGPVLEALIDNITSLLPGEPRPNACLVNWYRGGEESIGWHADDEPHIIPNSPIYSVSLLSTRDFLLRPKDGDLSRVHTFALAPGDLIVMGGATQFHWQHSVPKRAGTTRDRLNLTFRTYQEA